MRLNSHWPNRDPIEDEAFRLTVLDHDEVLQDALQDEDFLPTNPYLFVRNTPVTLIDLFGLWSPGAHDALIEHALKGTVKPPFISIIQQSSRDFDKSTQSTDESYKHSMRKKGQSAAAAITQRDKFINDTLDKAKKLADEGKCKEALKLLGEALHPIMDSSSPMHTDSSGNPKEWNPWKPWGHSPNDSIGKERKQDITPAVYTDQDKRIKEAFDKVFQKVCPCRKEVDP